jgi:putative endonuclease
MPHYVYLARCSDGSLYTGTCIDPSKREQMHNDGKGAKYTRSRRPVTFVYVKKCRNLSYARKREAAMKRLSRREKEALLPLSPTSRLRSK